MPDLNLVWVISHDTSLQQRLHEQLNVIQAPFPSDLTSNSATPAVIIYDPDERTHELCQMEIATLQGCAPTTPVLALSGSLNHDLVYVLLRAGVCGYLVKSETDARINEALTELFSGGMPLSSQIAAILMTSLKPHLPRPGEFNLKQQEVELLQLLSEGLTKKDISKKYNRSVHTIDNHVRQIYTKMKVNNLGQAVGEAFRAGIIN